jgi:FlaA1/EpsC-like NDP-sugar epimerase
MSRFNISLEDGVAMVMYAIEHGLGKEIFVPKIPSYNIITLADAIAPNCKKEVIGIRPGEKLHEEMITESDSFNTIEMEKYYIILPSDAETSKYLKHFNANPVEIGFKYNSGTNEQWLTVEQIRKLIKDFVDPNFTC